MDTAAVVDLAREALWVTLLVSAPLLGVALIIGLLIGVIQAATSINEATLSFIPKLVAIALAIVVFGNWQLSVLEDFIRSVYHRIPALFA
jgi:flagellar biosynthesis protein FliQ